MKLLPLLLFIPLYCFAPAHSERLSREQSVIFRAFTEPFSPELCSLAIYTFISEPEIALAQSRLETGNYTSPVFASNFNLFGMRHPKVRQTYSKGNNGYYAYYSHWIFSVLDYQLMLNYYFSRGKDFQYVMKVYCPDKDYATKLNKI